MLTFTTFLSCKTIPEINQKRSVKIPEIQENFEELMKKDALDRKARAISSANQFLNESLEDPVAAVLIENATDCNVIIKLSGQKNYTLPVPKNGKNFLIIPKGSYVFQGKVCNSDYRSSKNIAGSISILLSEH